MMISKEHYNISIVEASNIMEETWGGGGYKTICGIIHFVNIVIKQNSMHTANKY
jgi:hypothetical protein